MTYHEPVLLIESVNGLNIKPEGTYVDVTFGGGGHSRLILSKLNGGRLVAFDQDNDARQNIPDDGRFIFVQHNFRFLKNFLNYNGIQQIDGILADLGVSSHQFDMPERGFSFRADAPLDMRMNQQSEITARKVLSDFDVEQLADIFFYYGEIANARKLAACIVQARRNAPIETVSQLLEAAKPCIPRQAENKFMAQMFQALRIEVNGELDALKSMLVQAAEMLAPGGRLVIITYHSLEDRLVKNFMKTSNFEGKAEKDFYGNVITQFKLINKNVITPADDEIKRNNRARSAKLRIAEKV